MAAFEEHAKRFDLLFFVAQKLLAQTVIRQYPGSQRDTQQCDITRLCHCHHKYCAVFYSSFSDLFRLHFFSSQFVIIAFIDQSFIRSNICQ